MEINLMYVFVAVAVLGVSTLAFIFSLMGSVKNLKSELDQNNLAQNNKLDGFKSDIASTLKGSTENATNLQKKSSELLQGVMNDLQSAMTKSMSINQQSLEQQFHELQQVVRDSVQATNKSLIDISSSVDKKITDTKNEIAKEVKTQGTESTKIIQKCVSDNMISTGQKIDASTTEIEKELKAQSVESKKATEKFISDNIAAIDKNIDTLSIEIAKEIKIQGAESAQVIQKCMSDNMVSTGQKIDASTAEIEKDLKTQTFDQKQVSQNNLLQLTSLIQGIRVENLTEITNSLAKQKNLKISTSDFEKELGDCKVVQMKDKHTGQVTHINYEKGIKRSSDTLAGNILKYKMSYDDDGKVTQGIEFNDKGDVAFEYKYDKAGEINQRIEYIYTPKSKTPQKIKKAYK